LLLTTSGDDFGWRRTEALGWNFYWFSGSDDGIIVALSVTAFSLYAPLSYGNMWTQNECKRVKLFDTWDWDCNNFLTSYDQYANLPSSSANSIIPTSPPSAQPNDDAIVTPGKPVEVPPQRLGPPPPEVVAAGGQQQVIHREEKIEYRDAQGNILNPEQVEELKGKVKFETKYETRTRILDAQGKQIYEGPVEHGVAPPHPDVEGANPETPVAPEGEKAEKPDVATDEIKEKSAEKEEKKAKPASEGNEATET